MKKLITFCIFTALMSACATKELPLKGQLTDSSNGNKDIEISAEKINDYSDMYNVLLQINFENKGGNFVRINSAEIDLSNADGLAFNIVVGKDLVTWAEAKAEAKKIDTANEEIESAGTMLAGGALAIVGILSKNSTLATVGGAAYVGGAGWSIANEFTNKKKGAQGVATVPDSHLYAPFTVPSMSMVKRWVLINVPSGRISRVAKLKLKTVEGDTLDYNLDLLRKK